MTESSRDSAREKAASLRAEAARRDRQRRQLVVAGTGLVLVIVIAVVAIVVASRSSTPGTQSTTAADSAFIGKMTTVPAAVYDKVGAPATASATILKVPSGQILTKDGKPRVVYVGAEFCPFCAGERWALVGALARFGTFTGLAPTRSAANDGNIPTVTFVKSTYTSDVIAFDAYETQDRNHQPLQTLPDDITRLITRYDAPPYVSASSTGAIPWTWFGPWQTVGSSVDLTNFTGGGSTATVTFDQVAAAMQSGSRGLGASIDAAANVISAQVCQLTGGKPAQVCTSAGVTAAAATLPR